MFNMDNKPSADSIPFLLFMEEQEEEAKRQQLLKERTNRRDREQSEDNPSKFI